MTLDGKLLLRRTVPVKSIVTPEWKTETQTQLEETVRALDYRIQILDSQLRQSSQPQPELSAQRAELLQRQQEMSQRLEHVKQLQVGQEVIDGQVDNFFYVAVGENLIEKMQVEIILHNGVIKEIRGSL